MTTAQLGFTVRIAAPGADLADVATLRALAYGHHLPGMARGMAAPDAADTAPGSTVLLCRDKVSGQAIGSARIQRNHPRPLAIEASVALPATMAGLARAEITRLAIAPGAPSLVRLSHGRWPRNKRLAVRAWLSLPGRQREAHRPVAVV